MTGAGRAWRQDVTRGGSGTIGRCPIGPVLDGHRATADDQRMPERTSEAVAPPWLRRLRFGGPYQSLRRED